jgi:uncharacterized protein (DUF302 family)
VEKTFYQILKKGKSMKYYYSCIVNKNFEDAIAAVTEALKKEGFGILSQINIAEKLKEKLGVDFKKYIILGACNPALAHKALQTEDKIGVMLPCNVIVQDRGSGQVEIAAIDPSASMAAVGNPTLLPIAEEVSKKLKNAIDNSCL